MSGEALTRGTIWVALLLLVSALTTMPWLGERRRLVRAAWLLGWLAYVAHFVLAMHHHHGWSHEAAVRHVDERSGFGPGIFFSHLFTLMWTADVVWWCISPSGWARRPTWIGLALYIYMAFIAFNATVVYETGVIRAAGIVASVALAASLAARFYLRAGCQPAPEPLTGWQPVLREREDT